MGNLINGRFYHEPWLTTIFLDHPQTHGFNMENDRMAQTSNGQVLISQVQKVRYLLLSAK